MPKPMPTLKPTLDDLRDSAGCVNIQDIFKMPVVIETANAVAERLGIILPDGVIPAVCIRASYIAVCAQMETAVLGGCTDEQYVGTRRAWIHAAETLVQHIRDTLPEQREAFTDWVKKMNAEDAFKGGDVKVRG